jgi:hypothetical protein
MGLSEHGVYLQMTISVGKVIHSAVDFGVHYFQTNPCSSSPAEEFSSCAEAQKAGPQRISRNLNDGICCAGGTYNLPIYGYD